MLVNNRSMVQQFNQLTLREKTEGGFEVFLGVVSMPDHHKEEVEFARDALGQAWKSHTLLPPMDSPNCKVASEVNS